MSARQATGGGGDGGAFPAEISQADWDRFRGHVMRIGGAVETLRGEFKQTNAQLELVRIEARELRSSMASFQTNVIHRLEKHSDWRETTGKRELAELEREVVEKEKVIEKLEDKEEKRMALWLKVAIGFVLAIAEAAVVHFLKW